MNLTILKAPLCAIRLAEQMFQKVFISGRKKSYSIMGVRLTLVSVLVEMRCSKHGLERFKVKIIKRFNIASDKIIPKLRSKPARGELNLVYVGRNVSYSEVKNYLIDYFRERGMLEEIVRMKMSV